MLLLLSLLNHQVDLPPLPAIQSEFRGAWVATVDNIDWPIKRGEDSAIEQKEMIAILDKAVALHLNAIVLQVRPSADALYPSKFEPWSEYLTGKQGMAPHPRWDPLKFAVAEAHKRGLELHAWFNPYRAQSLAQKGPSSPGHISHSKPEVVKKYGPFLWMDPGEKFVQQRSLAVILDVVKRYDIDGVHMDDYFYPYKEKDKNKKEIPFPDNPSFKKYQEEGGELNRDDWRRRNVDDFVHRMYDAVKRMKPWVKVGISPFGIYRPGMPTGIKAGVDQYAELYADPRKWLQSGWVDYLSPQLYWPIKQAPQAYDKLLHWWVEQNGEERHVWPGNYTGLVSPKEGKWQPQEVLDQIQLTRDTHPKYYGFSSKPLAPHEAEGASGNLHFSFKVFQEDPRGLDEALLKGPYKHLAMIPASPWLTKSTVPTIKKMADASIGIVKPVKGIRFYLWNMYNSVSGWQGWVGSDEAAKLPSAGSSAMAVVGVDLFGRATNSLTWSYDAAATFRNRRLSHHRPGA